MSDQTKLKWITDEQRKQFRGIFKHEDEIWPDGYVQLWIPNDFNHFAVVLGYKGLDENGDRKLCAGFRNPFGADPESTLLPAEEYKHWCEVPQLSEEMKEKRRQILAEQDKGNCMYPYQRIVEVSQEKTDENT